MEKLTKNEVLDLITEYGSEQYFLGAMKNVSAYSSEEYAEQDKKCTEIHKKLIAYFYEPGQ